MFNLGPKYYWISFSSVFSSPSGPITILLLFKKNVGVEWIPAEESLAFVARMAFLELSLVRHDLKSFSLTPICLATFKALLKALSLSFSRITVKCRGDFNGS